MQICGFNKTTLIDYPEHLACVIFLGGCNFRCPFCQNGQLVLAPAGQPALAKEEIIAHLKKRRGILEGICISGGEPTLAPDLLPFLSEIKALGYLVKLDTNGSRPDVVKETITNGLADYIAMDIKSSLTDYPLVSGCPAVDLEAVAQTARLLMAGSIAYEFRTTVVKPLHTLDSLLEIGRWLAGASPYYLQSYRESEHVIGSGLSAYSTEEMLSFQQTLLPFLPHTKLRAIEI